MSNHVSKAREAYEERRSAINSLTEIGDAAGDAPFTEEQRASVDRINIDIDRLDANIVDFMKEGERQLRSAELDALVGTQTDEGLVNPVSGYTPIEEEARALFLGPNHADATNRLDFSADHVEASRLARRDLTAGTATDGAELVPTTLFGQLYTTLREGADSMFSLGRSVITQGGEAMEFPKNTAFSSAVLLAEAAALTESDPQFGTVTANAYKYGLAIQVTPELEADSAVPGALPWIIEQAVDGIRRGVGAALLTADGTAKPDGVMNGTNAFALAGVTYPTANELIETMYDITGPYRQNASWLFNDDSVKGVRLLKDSDGQYIWQPGLQAGKPDILLGHSVHTDAGVATIGANAKIGAFGDFNRGYLVRTVGNIRAERSVDYAFMNDLITWRFLGRFDGVIIDDSAYSVITCAAA